MKVRVIVITENGDESIMMKKYDSPEEVRKNFDADYVKVLQAKYGVADTSRILGVSKATLYNDLKK